MKFLEEYFDYQKKYPDSIILVQKGKFYECYEYDTFGKAFILGNIINTTVTLCNKSKNPSITNPYMAGFQTGYIDRNLPLLLDNHYTVVVIDEDPKNVTLRKIKAIYSPGTYTEKNTTSNNIVCIYVEKNHFDNIFISLTSIDLSTGYVYLYEIHEGNQMMKIEECYRINESQNPSEVLVVSNKELCRDYKVVFQNMQRKVRFLEYNSSFNNISFQNEILKDVYKIKSTLSAIEYLQLEQYMFATYSFVYLIHYCLEHNKHVVYNLNLPIVENFENKMILHNNSIYQLNIVNFTQDKSLFSIINYTSTPLGKRLLHKTLLNPISDINKLQQLYDDLEQMIPLYASFEEHLRCITDIEKMHRKMGLCTLKLFELWNLCISYKNLTWILKHENIDVHNQFENYYNHVKSIFVFDALRDNNDYEISIFQQNVHPEIDDLYEQIKKIDESLELLCGKMNSHLPKNARVKLEYDHIETTHARAKKLKECNNDYSFVVENKTRTLIKNEEIDSLFHEKLKCVSLIKPSIESKYSNTLKELYNKYSNLFNAIHEIVAYADLKKSKAKCSILYNYVKPTLDENRCLQIRGMKHPIITQLDNDVSFDPYNVNFSESKLGMLLYGVNGSGKSTYSKSVALNVVLAQSGHFVCAEYMKFKPFERLYTRLGDADNIYKGQSSFFVEMGELNSILEYANSDSLIIGDEPCRGTEDNSALAIVSYTIERLMNKKSTFVFATHLHRLTEISCIKDNHNLMIKHVSIMYNTDNILVYTHKIEDGKCKRNYGLEIAQKVLDIEDFDQRTNELFNEITKSATSKQSRYNKNVIVKKCEICNANENLQTHHIIHQHTFNVNSADKNKKNNLVVLCEKHHTMTHKDKLIIKGWKQSIEGRYLDYYMI
jgi:DNA mismatch repair protein MutS